MRVALHQMCRERLILGFQMTMRVGEGVGYRQLSVLKRRVTYQHMCLKSQSL